MSFLSTLKRALGAAAMTNPVSAVVYSAVNQPSKKPAPKAAPRAAQLPQGGGEEQEAASASGGAEMEAYRRMYRRDPRRYFPSSVRGIVADDENQQPRRDSQGRIRPEGKRDDLAPPSRGVFPRRPKGKPDDMAPIYGKMPERPRGQSDDLMGFADEILGEAPPAPPPDMNRLASGSVITNEVFRAIVWRNAQKASGRATPDTKAVALAESATKEFLRLKGIRISLPGARPGRRTV